MAKISHTNLFTEIGTFENYYGQCAEHYRMDDDTVDEHSIQVQQKLPTEVGVLCTDSEHVCAEYIHAH